MKKSLVASLLAVTAFSIAAPAAQASTIVFAGELSGAAEVPPNASPGSGPVLVSLDTFAHTLQVQTTFSGLLGTTRNAHIHCCTASPGAGVAGVATTTPSFVGFPLGVTSGAFDQTYDLTLDASWNPSFIAAHGGTTSGAEAFLTSGMLAGESYFNIHTSLFRGGEIRSFLEVDRVIPEPGTVGLLGLGAGAIFVALRRRRR